MEVFCPDCGAHRTLQPEAYSCACGGAWEPEEQTAFDPVQILAHDTSIWRYRAFFNLAERLPMVHLGAGWTPLLSAEASRDHDLWFKPEYFAPTASFKDRGTELMISILAGQGVTRIADDSSGNAGASVSAYAARAHLHADIFVPAYASPAKQAQIAVYGATVHPVPGPRANAKQAALDATRGGVTLASHAYHPGFLLGQQTLAWEIWEQLGRRAPDWYVVPVGQGVHLLGVWLGFRRLRSAGLIDRLPHMVGVQPSRLAPLHRAYHDGLTFVPGVEPPATPSIAEGLAIASPVRGKRLLQALTDTKGTCVTVEESDILTAQTDLARQGLFVEPTSATALAGYHQISARIRPGDCVVVPLTGSGLKGKPTLDANAGS